MGGGHPSDNIISKEGGGGVPGGFNRRSIKHRSLSSAPLRWTQIAVIKFFIIFWGFQNYCRDERSLCILICA